MRMPDPISLVAWAVAGLLVGTVGFSVLPFLFGDVAPQTTYEDADTICHGYQPTKCYDKATGEWVCSYSYGQGPGYDCREDTP